MSAPAADRARTQTTRELAGAVGRLIRWENCVAVGLTAMLGAHLGGGALTARGFLAAWTVMILHAAGTALNDRLDVAVDRLARPQRPLPSGRLSFRFAERLTVALALGGLALAASLGWVALAVAGLVVVASTAYAVRLKSTVLIGNLTVAGLSAATVPFGASVVREWTVPTAAIQGGVLILAYMVAYEVLKCLQDIVSDAAAGIRTIATSWGASAARVTAMAALAVFTIVALQPLAAGSGTAAYGIAVMLPLACVLGAVLSACLLPPPLAWDWAVGWLKVGWFVSLPALGLLG